MGAENYRVVFRGEISEGKHVDEVKQNLAALFKTDVAKLEDFFSGTRNTVKRDLSLERAQQYKAAIEKTGAQCAIEQEEDGPPAPPSPVAETHTLPDTVTSDILTPKKIPPSDRHRPRPVFSLSGSDAYLSIGRKDFDEHLSVQELIAVSAFLDSEDNGALKLLFFTSSDQRPFLLDAHKICFDDFSAPKGENTIASLRNFLQHLKRAKPSLCLDPHTASYLQGTRPGELGKSQLPAFVTGLVLALAERGFSFPQDSPAGPPKARTATPGEKTAATELIEAPPAGERIRCPKCGLEQKTAEACKGCGVVFAKYYALKERQAQSGAAENLQEVPQVPEGAAPGPRQQKHALTLEFKGGMVTTLGHWLLVANPLVLPVAWGVAYFFSWVSEQTELSHGQRVLFTGKGEQIWWAPVLSLVALLVTSVLVGLIVPRSLQNSGGPGAGTVILALLVALIGVAASLYFVYRLLQWVVESFEFSWGGSVSFGGTYPRFLGLVIAIIAGSWAICMVLGLGLAGLKIRPSPAVIIPLAIVLISLLYGYSSLIMLHWVFSRTSCSTGEEFSWSGTGLDLSWRVGSLVALPCVIQLAGGTHPGIFSIICLGLSIILNLWLCYVYFCWFVENIVIE